MIEIRVLNKEIIDEVFTIKDSIEADKEALSIYSKGHSEIPLRVNIDVKDHHGQSLYMPGYTADAKALGVKIVSVYPDNINRGIPSVPSTMVLLDDETGQVVALIDGTYLTQVRTGAVAGAATDILARSDSKTFTMFGAGGQAPGQIAAIMAVRPIEKAYICDLDKERAKQLAEQMSATYGIPFMVPETTEEAVRASDIISCATTTKRPLFKAEWVQPGTHINGIGSYTPEMHEIDSGVLVRAEGIYVDTRDGVLNESGDLIIPIREGVINESQITGELGEVINGNAPGRRSDEGITFFKSTGSAVMDIVNARKIYEKALEKQKGQIIYL